MAKQINPVQLKVKATCVVFSWMGAWKLSARLPLVLNEGDFVIENKRIILREDLDSSGYDFALSPSIILGPDLRKTLAELHRLTEFLGHGSPAGFRNVTGTKRASSNDYLGVSMRLTPFGRTPNAPIEDIMKWMPTLKREADRAARRCSGILKNMGLDVNDLRSIGLVYLSNYLNRHQTLDNDKINGANLTLSLVQEFGRWANTTIRYLKNVAPVTAGLPIDYIVGTPCLNSSLQDAVGTDHEANYVFNPDIQNTLVEDEETFSSLQEESDWLRRKAIKDGRYMAKRRRNAKAMLDLALSDMSHDRMVFVLSEVRDSVFQHPDARGEADNRLNSHKKACETCQSA